MRIILTTHVFYPEGPGGVSRYAETVAREFIARGHQVALLTSRSNVGGDRPGARYQDDEWHGLPVRRLTFNLGLAPNPYHFEWDNPWVNERILEYVQEQRAQIVHLAHAGHLSLSAVPLIKQAGAVAVGQVHDYWFICPVSNLRRVDGSVCSGPDLLGGECIRCVIARPWTHQDTASDLVKRAPNVALKILGQVARTLPNPPGRWATIQAQTHRLEDMRHLVSQMDALVCPSEFVADLLRRNGFDLARLRLLPYGIDPPGPAAPPPVSESGVVRLGFLGRLEPTKGLHVLVDAVRSLPAGLPVEVEIYGYEDAPDYVAALKARSADEPRLRFMGAAPSAAAALPNQDALVMPSLWYEVYPLVVREAQALGLPVVASDLGAMREAVRDGVDGLLFPPGDVAALARALRRLVEEPGLLARLRANVRPPTTTAEHAEALLGLYRSLLAQPSGVVGPTASSPTA